MALIFGAVKVECTSFVILAPGSVDIFQSPKRSFTKFRNLESQRSNPGKNPKMGIFQRSEYEVQKIVVKSPLITWNPISVRLIFGFTPLRKSRKMSIFCIVCFRSQSQKLNQLCQCSLHQTAIDA